MTPARHISPPEVEVVPARHHGVPRSAIHLIARRCWQAVGFGQARYVYLTDIEVECARQNTDYLVAYAERVEGEHFVPVAAFPIPRASGDVSFYKAVLIANLKDSWAMAKARGLVR